MGNEILNISLNDIEVVSNPRTEFDENGLKELSQSIKAIGVIEPIIVKPTKNGKYRLICVERRYRASLLAGKPDIRAEVRDIPDNKILQFQIVENLQRRGLSTMVEIRAICRLREEESMTETEIARAIGKHLSHVAAQVKISKAVPEVHRAIEQRQVSRQVGLLISALDPPEKQIKAVAALKRENIVHQVKAKEAEKWISRNFGAQRKNNYGRNGQTKLPQGKFVSDWKYYLIRFSPEQFESFQAKVRSQTETEVWANAVESVMNEAQEQVAHA